VSFNAEPWSWESASDILDYVRFAGYEMTRDQLARLYRRRLINQPIHSAGAGRGQFTMYPAGTAQRTLRIAQLKSVTKQMDELAWRLWWEGYDVDPDLVRSFLIKKAGRWDEQLREARGVVAVEEARDDVERDVLDEVFFQHLKAGTSMTALRKQIGRGSEIFVQFSGLFIELVNGQSPRPNAGRVGLFGGEDGVGDGEAPREVNVGELARRAMREHLDRAYTVVVHELDDKEIADARTFALWFLSVIANVGGIVQDVFGGVGRGRDNVGRSLIALSESPDEQVLALLLTSAFLHNDDVRGALVGGEALASRAVAIGFRDFLRLRFLAEHVPGLGELVSGELVTDAFRSDEGARRWDTQFEAFRLAHQMDIDDAVDLEPGLFFDVVADEPDEPDEVAELLESKKKILN